MDDSFIQAVFQTFDEDEVESYKSVDGAIRDNYPNISDKIYLQLKKIFSKMDRAEKGYLERKQMQRVFKKLKIPVPDDALTALILFADDNIDGVTQFAEFCQIY